MRRAMERRTASVDDPPWPDAYRLALAAVAKAAGRYPEPDRDRDPDFTGDTAQLEAIVAQFNDDATHEQVLAALHHAANLTRPAEPTRVHL